MKIIEDSLLRTFFFFFLPHLLVLLFNHSTRTASEEEQQLTLMELRELKVPFVIKVVMLIRTVLQ